MSPRVTSRAARALRRRAAIVRHRRLRARLAGPRLIAAFAAAHPRATFVEVGANDGEQHDHLREHVLAGGWRGLMVEPVPYVFERLERNYADVPGVTCVNAAVGAADGRCTFHHLRDASPAERAVLPDWYDGIGSFSRAAVLSHAPQIPDVEGRIVEREVDCMRLETLLERHGLERLDLLVIDTEGHEWEILRTFDLRRHGPRLLVYEHFHLAPSDRAAARAHVEAAGYRTLEEGFDTFCLRPRQDGARDALERAFDRARPAVPAVSKADELTLADTSVALPTGAAERLRDDHPRLAQLRSAYRGHPAAAASRRSAERVAAFLDLRYFRGETLIMWHYRDDPEATLRRYRELHERVRAADPLGLLDRLREDGSFGCFSFDVGGSRVSRDLLDSVVELNFLAREVGLEGARVLDVGAGYGRLAHRAVEAGLGVADWCCVDAVAESTFVCEYHLDFRDAIPPARVLAVDEVERLAPGAFDLAVNVHSFSEMPLAAIGWWLGQLERLAVPALMIVPNDGERLVSLEPDGARRDFGHLLAGAGYELVRSEPAPRDRLLLFARP